MSDPRGELALLAANLTSRARLGLDLVTAKPADLERLVGLVLPSSAAAGPGPSPSPSPGTPGPDAAYPDLSGAGLEQIQAAMRQCDRCPLHQDRRHIVFGRGGSRAGLVLVGEGPGAQEDARGVPFVGPAGQLLDRILAALGLGEDEVYITNIVKCRPPGNRDPQPGEAAACRPFLDAQLAALSPRVICTLGRPASQALLQSQAPISALRGRWKRMGQSWLLPTYHPAFLLRNPGAKAQVYRDFKALKAVLRGGEPSEEA